VLGLTRGGIAAPFYAHTPAAALLVAPLVPLGFRAAALVSLALSTGLIVHSRLDEGRRRSPRRTERLSTASSVSPR
jgi:hypothetical protein